MTKLNCKTITTPKELLRHEQLWESFRANLNHSSMCLSWYWLSVWCHHYLLPKDKLVIKMWFDNENLVAILPLYIKKKGLLNELRFVGTGENEEIEVCSEFQDLMILPNYQSQILSHFNDFITLQRSIHLICFENYLLNGNVATWLSQFNHVKWKPNNQLLAFRYRIAIKNSRDLQILEIRSKTARRHARKAIIAQCLTFELVTNEVQLKTYFSLLVQLHNHAWRKKGKNGAFLHSQFVNFHREYASRMLKEGRLILFILKYNENAIAAFYGVIDQNTLFYYQSGIAECDQIPSVGIAMHMVAMDIAREKKLTYYDLMKGTTHSYKNKFQEKNEVVKSIQLSKFPYSYLALFDKIKNKLRQITLRFMRY